MTGIVLTQSGTFIIGDIARILGWIMNVLFNFLDQVFGIQNIGLCIILFTIIIYLLMLPLTIKQQRFSKFSAKMNPELKAIQKKYANKKDALEKLNVILSQRELEEKQKQVNSAWREHTKIVRGNPVRVYEGVGFKRKR